MRAIVTVTHAVPSGKTTPEVPEPKPAPAKPVKPKQTETDQSAGAATTPKE